MLLNKVKQNYKQLLLLFVLTILYTYMYHQTNHHKLEFILYKQNDLYFHFSRILSLDNVFSSPVNFKYFAHNGTMVNLFYPWITVFPLFKLFQWTHYNLILAYYLFWLVMTFVTLVITYYAATVITQNKWTSVLISALYTFSLVRTSDIYQRVAIGETVAMTFLPLVLLSCYYLFYQQQIHKWYILTIAMT